MVRLVALLAATAHALSPNQRINEIRAHSVPFSRRDAVGFTLASVVAQLVTPEEARAAGVTVEDVRPGVGEVPTAASTITLDFTGKTGSFDGTTYYASSKSGLKIDLTDTKLAPGIVEGILAPSFRVGGVRRIVVPPSEAYGATGYPVSGPDAGKLIGPNESLYVEVRLRSIALSKGLGYGLNLI
mmetsp:Transcript_24521/g.73600  ORF Transcript_24521/g.73600 Transcript_24521/m.73600 type:complete len:185 (+) Transcript_24521:216-770(+)